MYGRTKRARRKSGAGDGAGAGAEAASDGGIVARGDFVVVEAELAERPAGVGSGTIRLAYHDRNIEPHKRLLGKLKGLLTQRQEAMLVMMGLLE